MNEKVNAWQRGGFSQSFAMVPMEAIYSNLSKRQLMVLIVLCAHSDKKTGNVIISRAKVSLKTGIHISDISKTYGELEKLGFIKHRQQIGLNACNTFLLTVPSDEKTKQLVIKKHGIGTGHGKGNYLPEDTNPSELRPRDFATKIREVKGDKITEEFEDPFEY